MKKKRKLPYVQPAMDVVELEMRMPLMLIVSGDGGADSDDPGYGGAV